MPLEEKVTVLIPQASDEAEEAFKEFMRHYPRQTDKARARLVFMQIINGGKRRVTEDGELTLRSTPDKLIQAAKSYRESLIDRNTWTIPAELKRFIPHARTWLNQGRFEDEI